MRDVFPPPVTEALHRLTAAGYEAFVVGGSVRDLLRGAAPGDYDVTTSARPEQIREVFAGVKTVDTGVRHGTLTVLLSGMPLEITTYRLETAYTDHRHPDEVVFTPSLREDLARRDFTVNAMAMTAAGTLVDPFGGQSDLAAGLLRCVGDPARRFEEDALRILRLLRFSSKLGFRMEEKTLSAAEDRASLLAYVSAERIREELFGLLRGIDAGKTLLRGGKILRWILPACYREDGSPAGDFPSLISLLPQVSSLSPDFPPSSGSPPSAALVSRLCALFFGREDAPQAAEALLTGLKTDRKTKEQVLSLLKNQNIPLQSDADLLFACGKLTPEGADRLLTLRHAAARVRGEDGSVWEGQKARLAVLLAEGRCFRLRDLKLNGDRLRRIGVPAGRAVGEMLERLLAGVIRGEIENTPEALERAVREMRSE